MGRKRDKKGVEESSKILIKDEQENHKKRSGRLEKINLYQHFQMDEKSVDDLLGKFSEVREKDLTFAVQNLVETILNIIEYRDLAKQVYEQGFFENSKDELLNLDSMKNVKLKDILFFKDQTFRKRILKFFDQVSVTSLDNFVEDIAEFVHLLDWLEYLSQCKVREFRNFASQISLGIYENMVKTLQKHFRSLRDSNDKVGDFVKPMLEILVKYYFKGLVLPRHSDVDSQIRNLFLDHLFHMYFEGYYLVLDEAFYSVQKKSSKLLRDFSNEGYITRMCLEWMIRGMTDASMEKVSRYLISIPLSISKMDSDIRDNPSEDWKRKGQDLIDQNTAVLKSNTRQLIKFMVEQREEVGANLVSYFQNLRSEQLTKDILKKVDLSIIYFMVTSPKRKLKEMTCEFIYSQIKPQNVEILKDESAIAEFIQIITEIDRQRAERRGSIYEFNEEDVLQTMKHFIPRICVEFDTRTVAELFFGEKTLSEAEITHFRGYLGCLLYTLISAAELVSSDDLPNTKQNEIFKGTVGERIKSSDIAAKTMVKESMKKALTVTQLKNPEYLRIHLRLIEKSVDTIEEPIQDLLVSLYDKTLDRKSLKEISNFLRGIYDKNRTNILYADLLIEKINKLFETQIENFNKAIFRFKSLMRDEGLETVVNNPKIIEELRVCFRKVSPLKQLFQCHLGFDDTTLENLDDILAVYVADSMTDKEILEHAVLILYTNMYQLLSSMAHNDNEKKYIKIRDQALEYFMHFLEPRSLSAMAPSDAVAARRFIFVYLTETLNVVSNDDIAIAKPSTYYKPSEVYTKRIWEFVDSYCFTTKSGIQTEGTEDYQPMSQEKALITRMDEENTDNNGQKANHPRKSNIVEEFKEIRLRSTDHKFREDVQIMIRMVFRLGYNLLKSIGANLASRTIHRILNLNEHHGQLLAPIDSFFTDLLEKEKQNPVPAILYFWRLIRSCIDSFDLSTLRRLSKIVFSSFKKYSSNEGMVKLKYLPFCLSILNWAQEQWEDPQSNQKVILFIKKQILGDETTNRLLYVIQSNMEKLRSEHKENEAEFVTSQHYQHTVKLRGMLADLCSKQIKDDGLDGPESRAASRRVSVRKRGPSMKPMDEEKAADEEPVGRREVKRISRGEKNRSVDRKSAESGSNRSNKSGGSRGNSASSEEKPKSKAAKGKKTKAGKSRSRGRRANKKPDVEQPKIEKRKRSVESDSEDGEDVKKKVKRGNKRT